MEAMRTETISPERIMQLGLGFRASKTLLSAVALGLFTELAAAPLDGETLRRRLGLHRRGARDFFDTLVALGLLERRDGLYSNAPEAALHLDRDKPGYLGGMLEWAEAELYRGWASLTEALLTGRPQSGAADGADLFDALSADPATHHRFVRAMTAASLPAAQALARRFPWQDYRSFIDIGTAEGAVPVAIAALHPHLSGGGFDLPHLRPGFEAYVRRHALEDRLRFHAGDFLREPLPRAEVLVMGQILHDWDLGTKQALLAKAHAALPPGGALILCDQMIDDARRENLAGLLMSLNMLVRTQGGFDYTGADCIGWMREAGFAELRQETLAGPFAMITGIKPAEAP